MKKAIIKPFVVASIAFPNGTEMELKAGHTFDFIKEFELMRLDHEPAEQMVLLRLNGYAPFALEKVFVDVIEDNEIPSTQISAGKITLPPYLPSVEELEGMSNGQFWEWMGEAKRRIEERVIERDPVTHAKRRVLEILRQNEGDEWAERKVLNVIESGEWGI